MKHLWLVVVPSVVLATSTFAENSKSTTTKLASTGTGAEYASACISAISAWSFGSSSWSVDHRVISTTTYTLGGSYAEALTLYENATTLCDGHPRVTKSPAIPISTGTTTIDRPITGITTQTNTQLRPGWTESYPSCRVSPTDCDPFWSTYHEQVAAAAAMTPAPQITIATPPCANDSLASQAASAESKIRGCGKCTIYGDGVELVFFPTTASRDMCATTPTDSITHYGNGAVITAYAGTEYRGPEPANGAKTAVVDGHTFTSGTAYISIRRVSAVDRCTKTYGSVVSNAILAMPSESILSLRYRQNHHQALMETDKVTGYPVRYQDFNTPIPWSAWIGQNRCDIGIDEYRCGVIYENDYRPQLAIPPEITSLSPDFEDCEMWYNGLFDPPLALTEHSVAAGPTLPGAPQYTTESASPSSTVVVPTITATKLANEVSTTAHASSYPVNKPEVSHAPNEGPAQPNVDDGTTVISGHASSKQAQQPQESHAHHDGPTIPAVGITSSTTVIEQHSPSTSASAAANTDLESAEGSSVSDLTSYESQTAVEEGPVTTAESTIVSAQDSHSSTTELPASSTTSSTPIPQATGGATDAMSTVRNSIMLIGFVIALALA